MELTSRVFTLHLRETFVISRSADDEADVLQVAIRHGDRVGYGESAPDPHYGETLASATAFVDRAAPLLGDDPFALEAVLGRIGELPGEMAAKCAIDGALHDLVGKLCGQPLWRPPGPHPGAAPAPPPTNSNDTLGGPARPHP